MMMMTGDWREHVVLSVTSSRAKVYVRDAMWSLFVESPIRYGSVVTFETIATVQDVYEVRAAALRYPIDNCVGITDNEENRDNSKVVLIVRFWPRTTLLAGAPFIRKYFDD